MGGTLPQLKHLKVILGNKALTKDFFKKSFLGSYEVCAGGGSVVWFNFTGFRML